MYFEVKNTITGELSIGEIITLESIAALQFNIPMEQINTIVSYITSGNMELFIPEDLNEEELDDAITSALANLLEIHPKDIIITFIDLETGIIEYDISSEIFIESASIQSQLDLSSVDEIEESIQQMFPEVEVVSVAVNTDIESDVKLVFDGSDARDIREGRSGVENILSILGYDVTIFHFL